MKIINIKFSFIAVAFALCILSACHKVSDSNGTAYIGLHMHTSIDTVQVDPILSNVYLYDSLGRYERLTLAQMYVTNISLRDKSSQQWYTVASSIILKRIQNELYPIGSVPAGTYDAIRFTIGLGNALNAKTPSWYTVATSPDTVLSTNEAAVMWGSMVAGVSGTPSGYTALNVQGYDSTDHVAFSYQLGGYGDTAVITLPYTAGFTLSPNEPQVVQYIHVIADYGTLLQNINLPMHPTGSFYSTNPTDVSNATNAWNNIINMFRYECPVPNGDC
jgi:hypothetical protein